MIDYIRGILTRKEIGGITVETGGVGYAVNIPLSTYEKLPGSGEEITVQIHYHVREDAHKLFGFATDREREIFRHLIGISKVGPKVALNVLSGISAADLVQSVNRGDSSQLQKIPGVGAKTAQRLVMELKGKFGGNLSVESGSGNRGNAAGAGKSGVKEELYAAMIALGYNEKQISKALDRIGGDISPDEPVEVLIRKILQVI
jgi:holliday junction DNA helicase RuvA